MPATIGEQISCKHAIPCTRLPFCLGTMAYFLQFFISPPPIPPAISDVQSANITFLNTTVSLYCVFAGSGSARGCRFVLSLADGTREEVDIPRPTAGGTVTLECAYTNNRRYICTAMSHNKHKDLDVHSQGSLHQHCGL